MQLKQTYLFVLNILAFIDFYGQQPKLVVPQNHQKPITTVKFSPDNKLVLTTSKDFTAKIWDARLGKLLHNLEGHSADINNAEFNKNGDKIVTASSDNTAKIWDVKTGKLLITLGGFKGHNHAVITAKFSDDGSKIITTSQDGTTKFWNTVTGNLIATYGIQNLELKKYFPPVIFAQISSNGKYLVNISFHKIVIYEMNTKKWLKEYYTWGDLLEVESDNKDKIFFHSDEYIRVLDINKALITDSFPIRRRIDLLSILLTPDGKIYSLESEENGTISLVDLKSRALFRTFKGHTNSVIFARFSKNKKYLLTIAMDSTLKIWNIDSLNPLYSFKTYSFFIDLYESEYSTFPTNGPTISAFFSNDEKKFVTLSDDNSFTIVDILKGSQIASSQSYKNMKVKTSYFGPKGEINIDSRIDEREDSVINHEEGDSITTYVEEINYRQIKSDPYSKDGRYRIELGTIYDATTGDSLYSLEDFIDDYSYNMLSYETIAEGFSPDGKLIYQYSVGDRFASSMNIFEAVTGKMKYSLDHIGREDGSDEYINAITFSPDSKRIITASNDKTAIIWNAYTGKPVDTLKGHQAGVVAAKVDSTGKYIVTSSLDYMIKVWDLKRGSLIKSFYAGGSLEALDFSRNRLLTIKNNETRLFNIFSGSLLATYYSLDSNEYLITLPSGYYMASPFITKHTHFVTKDLKIISFDQLDVKYNRPDKVLEAVGSTDTTLIRSYRKAWEKRIKKLSIDTTAFRDGYTIPECDFANREAIEIEQKSGSLKLHIKGNDSKYKLDRYNIWVNNVPVFGQRGVSLKNKNTHFLNDTFTICLSDGANHIEASITNVNGTESYRIPLQVNYTPSVKTEEKTWFVGIGIQKFADNSHPLQYSVKDIRDLAIALKEKIGNNLIVDTLFNENVTVEKIRLLKKMLEKTSQNDKVILAYSGHGMLSDSLDYYLSTYDINFQKPEINGLSYDELENLLDSIPARKKLMLIDACHSGEVDKEERLAMDKRALDLGLGKGAEPESMAGEKHLGLKNSFELMQSLFVNVGKSTGATIIAAAAGNQYALEGVNKLPNGIFTYCLLEAIAKNDRIKVNDLKNQVCQRVEEITKGLQKPTSRKENNIINWSLW